MVSVWVVGISQKLPGREGRGILLVVPLFVSQNLPILQGSQASLSRHLLTLWEAGLSLGSTGEGLGGQPGHGSRGRRTHPHPQHWLDRTTSR